MLERVSVGRRSPWAAMWPLLLYALLASSYFVLRYGGRWSDSDTANFSVAIRGVYSEATLVPTRGLYGLGFAYQAVSAFALHATGVSLQGLQSWVYPLVAAGLSVVAFALYRLLTGDMATGALAALLLFLQPDLLFVVFRGSHEKVTWLLALTALFLLTKSFDGLSRLPYFLACVLLFYLAALGVIASNAFFGSSFMAAIAVSLGLGLVLGRVGQRRRRPAETQLALKRLLYVALTVMVLWFLNTFYLYRPAARILLDIRRGIDQLAAVTLGREPTFDPYAPVGTGWISPLAYLGLMLPALLAAAVSFLAWVATGRRFLRGQAAAEQDPSELLLWLLYGGFGFQLGVSVVLDRLGFIAGNLQLRLFPAVMLMAVPLVARQVVESWRRRTAAGRVLVAIVLVPLLLWAAAAALLKATNDPALSNYWSFWTAAEQRAVSWVEEYLRYRRVWLGLDGIRLSSQAIAVGFGSASGNEPDTWMIEVDTRDVVLSAVDEALALRRGVPLPDVRAEHRVYDNGSVAHYHLRPRTPYQR